MGLPCAVPVAAASLVLAAAVATTVVTAAVAWMDGGPKLTYNKYSLLLLLIW